MKVSLNWLNDYIDLSGLNPETIAEALTRAGLEVEEIIQTGPRFTDVVVASVLAVDPHPNADKLRLVTVNHGDTTQVVCGASNVKTGRFIAFAKEGADVFSPKQNAMFKLGQAVIRGVASSGMICSLDELELLEYYPKAEDGIWPLDALVTSADIGRPLRDVLNLSGDTVLDVVPTANRGDAMSMLGIAREISALFGLPVKLPQSPALPSNSENGQGQGLHQVALSQPDVCSAYMGVYLDHVSISASPEWLTKRLSAAGIRPINNVVDITNYVMLEMGQPLHAFEADKLAGGEIDVILAEPGSQLVTLDDETRQLRDASVVVTCNRTPIALAGIMGGADSAVSNSTSQLLLESAVFPWAAIRKSSRSVALRTEASARYERGVDPAGYEAAAARAVDLLMQLTGATVQQVCKAVSSAAIENVELTVSLRLSRLKQILGMSIAAERVVQILTSLGFTVSSTSSADVISVVVPSYRINDVTREIDLIEEVIRIVGLDDLPTLLPVVNHRDVNSNSLEWQQRHQLRLQLVGQGFQEMVAPSLIGENLLSQTGIPDEPAKRVNVTNSHSPEHRFLRQSLLPNLLATTLGNLNNGQTNLQFFELGRTYEQGKGKPSDRFTAVQEQWWLAGLVTGKLDHWQASRESNYFSLLGSLQALLSGLGLSDQLHLEADSNAPSPWHAGRTALTKIGSVTLGRVGELHPQLKDEMKLRQGVWMFEWLLGPLLSAISTVKPVISLTPYPAVQRDLAFVAPDLLHHQTIADALKSTHTSDILRGVNLFDEYRSEALGQGQRSLAYRFTLQASDHTLTEAEITARIQALREQLQQQFAVQFRT